MHLVSQQAMCSIVVMVAGGRPGSDVCYFYQHSTGQSWYLDGHQKVLGSGSHVRKSKQAW